MKALHVICHRKPDGGWMGLWPTLNSDEYLSECWDIPTFEAFELVGGWLYFHESSSQPSTLAARILNWQHHPLASADRNGVGFIITKSDISSVKWRGRIPNQKHHHGGAVLADLIHEA